MRDIHLLKASIGGKLKSIMEILFVLVGVEEAAILHANDIHIT
jgi:hypothetical protein